MFIFNSYWFNITNNDSGVENNEPDIGGDSPDIFKLFHDQTYYDFIDMPDNIIFDYDVNNNKLKQNNNIATLSTDTGYIVTFTPKEQPETIYFEIIIQPDTLKYHTENGNNEEYDYGNQIIIGSTLNLNNFQLNGDGIMITRGLYNRNNDSNDFMYIDTPNINDSYSGYSNQRIGIIIDQLSGFNVLIMDGQFYTDAQTESPNTFGIYTYMNFGQNMLKDISMTDFYPVEIVTDRNDWLYRELIEDISMPIKSIDEANQSYSYSSGSVPSSEFIFFISDGKTENYNNFSGNEMSFYDVDGMVFFSKQMYVIEAGQSYYEGIGLNVSFNTNELITLEKRYMYFEADVNFYDIYNNNFSDGDITSVVHFSFGEDNSMSGLHYIESSYGFTSSSFSGDKRLTFQYTDFVDELQSSLIRIGVLYDNEENTYSLSYKTPEMQNIQILSRSGDIYNQINIGLGLDIYNGSVETKNIILNYEVSAPVLTIYKNRNDWILYDESITTDYATFDEGSSSFSEGIFTFLEES
jgi:hypothetical protein